MVIESLSTMESVYAGSLKQSALDGGDACRAHESLCKQEPYHHEESPHREDANVAVSASFEAIASTVVADLDE